MWSTGIRGVLIGGLGWALALGAGLAAAPALAQGGELQIASQPFPSGGDGGSWGGPHWRPGPQGWGHHDDWRFRHHRDHWRFQHHDPWWQYHYGGWHGGWRGWPPGYAPYYVPPRWVWDGWRWVLVPGYWR